MDFSDARGSDSGLYSTLRGQSTLLEIPGSPGGSGLSAGQNLRAAKSFADLRSYTPSPVPSSASFPPALGPGISRYTEYGATSVASATPSLTPTATPSNRDEPMLVNGLGNMTLTSSLGGSLGVGGSMSRDSRDPRGILSLDRDSQHPVGTGISGSGSRSFSMGYDEQSRNQAAPVRQPRGPAPERGTGFSRRQPGPHNNRGNNNGELDVQSGVEIVVE